ncbi:hypothetical protein VSR01_32745 [Actinacidiphila sp. DG2A-62]|uniref:hypothetical protein n=1 Tax=Actinacidiphila sp. DG2A-62 TaxID=3108821 RepID=UPI002DBE4FAB|nr:hypothetical protein [Actinacidiphila sp. DG2A-62]MEC3998000.1 hypothetical protein [Actinacidiphila sp. DG2A-62]
MVDEAAERLARLCAQAGDEGLRERAERYGVGDVLRRLRGAAGAGAVGSSASVLADLDALDDAFARHGIDGLTTGSRAYRPFAAGGHPVVTAWGCPAAAACPRLEPQERAPDGTRAAPPVCGLTDARLVSRTFRL